MKDLTSDQIAEAIVQALHENAKRFAGNKVLITLRLDRHVVERFQSAGRDWEDRINEALRDAAVGIPS